MDDLVLHAAGAVMATAAFFVVLVALGVMLGANPLRDIGLRLAGAAIALGIALRACAGLVGSADIGSGGEMAADPLLCIGVVAGHVVLAVALFLRWLRPRAGVERADEQTRARMRERVRSLPRDRDLEP